MSSFFTEFNEPGAGGIERFRSWAVWSGTSFSAPLVVVALAREMQALGISAREAVKNVIDDPGLTRLPDLGTIVNVS